jgi:Protein of unknown function (DUF3318)
MNRPDPSARSRHPVSMRASGDPKIRAIRKELLLARADLERLEIAKASAELRHGVTGFRWVRWVLPSFRATRSLRGIPAIGSLLEHYPLLGSLASLAVAGPIRRTVVRHAKPLLKIGALGVAGWQAYRIWRDLRSPRGPGDVQRPVGERAATTPQSKP